ncbi:aminotransferase class I/II-fold pyridoxal phosphate-dependent enzyme [Apilactobacillus timberlakei]|uniref:aminotransferase class I/II-fold pyridoxal phosphate-dependent enzyme n=1 Tax=Apilactobacillus timberlakei TaxID=2008380 RepID=UPI00142DFBFA|nr:aminotransferase class I/II-fold pyridoxal phosphate-dependent enzyme [Apilactobacillus timberlakei]
MIKQINKDLKAIKPNPILGFNEELSKEEGLIPLTLGEPDFNTPEHVKAAAISSINDNYSHYTNPRGILKLREAAAHFFAQKYGLNYDAKTQIITTAGVTEGIFDSLATILNPGDSVIVPTPTFPLYMDNIQLHGAHVIEVDTSEDGFVLTPEKLKQALAENENVKAIVINSPGNPTGISYDETTLKELAKVIKDSSIFCISDEIYSELTYGKPHVSIAKFIPEQTIVLNGLSKSHAMTGWRIGFIMAPADLIDMINVVHQYAVTSVTDNVQFAALEALNNGADDGLEMRDVYAKRLNLLRAGLSKAGFASPKPTGAFYIFAKIPEQFTQDDFAFSRQLAHQAKVGVIPGSSFGKGGAGYIRISYATSENNLKESIKRIQNFVKQEG